VGLTKLAASDQRSALEIDAAADITTVFGELDAGDPASFGPEATTSGDRDADVRILGFRTSDVRRSFEVRLPSLAVAAVLGLPAVVGPVVVDNDDCFTRNPALVASMESASDLVC
jgi:hypothetical protein